MCDVYSEGDARVVNVPNILLQDYANLIAYTFDTTHTKKCTVLVINRRAKPADYVYTETEVRTYDALDARVSALERGGSGGTGVDGESAYEIALRNGFEGSEVEWLESLKGEKGEPGEAGRTPAKGVDYFTVDDVHEIAESAAEQIVIPDETDPTVPEWAKQPEKPTYTATEVGALPASANERIAALEEALQIQPPVEVEEVETVIDRTSSLFTVMDGYINGIDGITENAAYRSYSLVATENCKCYIEPIGVSTTYLSIAVWHNNTISVDNYAGRYRIDEGNLPTADEPLQIAPNDLIIVSIQNPEGYAIGRNFSLHIISTQEVPKKEPVPKRKRLKYVNEAGAEHSIEKLEIYIPATVGYVRYDFLHCVRESNNANIWRIGFAYAVDDDLNERFALTTSGEWETTVKLSGRSDFSGGITHGDVQMKDILFFVNGSVADVTTITELTEFESLRIVQTSDFYDPSSQEDKISENGIEYIFTDNDVLVNQSLLWKVTESTQLAAAYMSMHLPAKACTDTFYTDVNIVPTLLDGTSYGRVEGARKAVVYGSTSGVFTEFSAEKYPTEKDGGNALLITDNGGGAYNKCYYVVSDHRAWVKADELWQSSVRYSFDVGK